MKYDLNKMLEVAKSARDHAYAPYSQFPVGVCIFTEDGQYYGGCNVENSSYPQGQCAEPTAIGTMIASGSRKIVATLVLTDTETGVSPCGGCLQKLSEFTHPETDVLIANLSGLKMKKKFKDLFHGQFSEVFTQLKNIKPA
ncbi:MAG: cytidine deaminase [Gammaproteobacteria bacterium]|nr:cytidine deaminase [Gammaproteobacteria bacterium]